MVATKKPYGAIHEDWVAYLLPQRGDKFYIIDSFSSIIEVEGSVYAMLEKKEVPIYEGTINQIRSREL